MLNTGSCDLQKALYLISIVSSYLTRQKHRFQQEENAVQFLFLLPAVLFQQAYQWPWHIDEENTLSAAEIYPILNTVSHPGQ